jgi:thymidylate synthase (FAD)
VIEYVNKVGVELIDCLASDDRVAMAAWVSNDMDSVERLGVFLWKVDVPLFVAREFQRHRTFSYNEVSGRYTQMRPRFWRADTARVQQGKMGNYYFVEGSEEQTALYRREKEMGLIEQWNRYQRLLDAGIAKEQAREDMPLSLMTQFYATSNPRNLMQFLTLRNDKHALAEIRDVAVQMEDIFAEKMPMTASAYRKYREIERKAMEQANQTTISNTLNVQTTTADPRKVAEQMVRQANLIKGKVKA